MHNEDELPIIRAFYEFIVWINPKIGKFPRDQRFTLGERMERQLYEVLGNLLRAKYRRERKKLLEEVLLVNLMLQINWSLVAFDEVVYQVRSTRRT